MSHINKIIKWVVFREDDYEDALIFNTFQEAQKEASEIAKENGSVYIVGEVYLHTKYERIDMVRSTPY